MRNLEIILTRVIVIYDNNDEVAIENSYTKRLEFTTLPCIGMTLTFSGDSFYVARMSQDVETTQITLYEDIEVSKYESQEYFDEVCKKLVDNGWEAA